MFGIHGVRALLAAEDGEIRRLVVASGRRNADVEDSRRSGEGTRHPRGTDTKTRIGTDRPRRETTKASLRSVVPSCRPPSATWPPVCPVSTTRSSWSSTASRIRATSARACARAEAAGADAVLVPKRGSAPLSSTVAKTASGALEHLFVVEVGNLARCLKWLREQGVWLAGGVEAGEGVPYTEVDCRGALGVVVGSEHRGLRRLTREGCDHLVTIPMAGATTSLNVSVHSASCCSRRADSATRPVEAMAGPLQRRPR